MKILIAGSKTKRCPGSHFSDFKDINLAIGFAKLGYPTFLLTEFLEFPNALGSNLVKLIHPKELSTEMLKDFTIVLFTRETWMKRWIDNVPCIRNMFFGANRHQERPKYLCMRYGHYKSFPSGVFSDIIKFYNAFDFHFVQTEGYVKDFMSYLPHKDKFGKIWSSPMGCPSQIPEKEETSPFQKAKYNLIYMGRLRHQPSRFDFIIKLMNKLGVDYKLFIMPGSYSRPSDISKKYSPEISKYLGWLRNYFSGVSNIEVLSPQRWGNHWKYLQHADIGIDFVSSRSRKGKSGGNAKLLEYLRVGLPAVTESGITNNYMIRRCNGGLISPTIENLDHYINNIQEAVKMEWDKDKMVSYMLNNEVWEIRAQEILDNISMVNDTIL